MGPCPPFGPTRIDKPRAAPSNSVNALPEGEVVRLDSGRDRDGEQPTTKRTRSDQLVEPRFAGYDQGSRRFAIDTHPCGPLPPEHQVDVLSLEPEEQGGTITRRRSL